jgi:hypothetical protein
MKPAEAQHQAEACRARLEARQALRPLARRSAEAAARAAEDRFTAARLDAWAEFLSTTH